MLFRSKEELIMTAYRNGNQIHIIIRTNKSYAVRLINLVAISVSQGEVKIDKKDTVITLTGDSDFTATF